MKCIGVAYCQSKQVYAQGYMSGSRVVWKLCLSQFTKLENKLVIAFPPQLPDHILCFHFHKDKAERTKMQQIAQRGCRFSLAGDIQELSGHSPAPCALGWLCLSKEVGSDEPLWSLPAWPILWHSDFVNRNCGLSLHRVRMWLQHKFGPTSRGDKIIYMQHFGLQKAFRARRNILLCSTRKTPSNSHAVQEKGKQLCAKTQQCAGILAKLSPA